MIDFDWAVGEMAREWYTRKVADHDYDRRSRVKLILRKLVQWWCDERGIDAMVRAEVWVYGGLEFIVTIHNDNGALDENTNLYVNKITVDQHGRIKTHRVTTDRLYLEPTASDFAAFCRLIYDRVVEEKDKLYAGNQGDL